ncbi:LysR family transcriptional regulator [Paralcaligenes ginsengisoli]
MKKLDIPTLEIFVAAVEEKSLSKAAERENLVTSAVSKRMTELERHLGKAVLLRHGRGVDPTPAGILLYQRAKSLLRHVKLTEKAINEFTSDGVAKIRLLANPSTVLQFLPIEMKSFLAKSKNISIDLVESHSYDIPRLVADDQADLGIYHADYPASGILSYPYKKDRVGLVVPNGHPLSNATELFLEDALEYDLLGYFPRHSLGQFLDYVGKSISRPPIVKLQVSNFETRCRMIQEGLGLGIVPQNIARNYLSQMGLVFINLRDAWAERQFYLCVNNDSKDTDAVQKLIKHLI